MRFVCPHCQKICAIDDTECGQPVGCGHCGGVTVVPESRFAPGAIIHDFIIKGTLGRGGMGTVYLAHQVSLDRPVALKILMEQYAGDSEFIVDFVKEARAAARLSHPNIVQSYAVGEEDGIYFFAMEYVEGKTLKKLMEEQGPIPVDQALHIIQQIAEALDFTWKHQQLVHRDIKPDNIMLTNRGVAKLADLGLARRAKDLSHDEDDEVMGTPQYICPEQLLGQPMDVRGDIYSLGASFYHAVTGHFPFEGDSPAEIARKHLQEPLRPAHEVAPEVPPTVSWIINKMMAKKIEDRYEDAAALSRDLTAAASGGAPVGYTGPTGRRPSGLTGKQAAHKPAAKPAAASAPAAAPAAAPESAPADESQGTTTTGGRKIRITRPGKKTGTTLTGAVTAPAEVGGGGKRSPLIAIVAAVGAVVVVVALIVSFGILKRANTPKSADEAQALYLQRAPKREAEDWQAIRERMAKTPKSTDDLRWIVAQLNTFKDAYTQSLFVLKPAATTDYGTVFRTPLAFLPTITDGVRKFGPQLAGTCLTELATYEELLAQRSREEAHGEYLKTQVDPRLLVVLKEDALEHAKAKFAEYVDKRKEELKQSAANLRRLMSTNATRWAKEKEESRLAIFDFTDNLRFDDALLLVEHRKKNPSGYELKVKAMAADALAEPEERRAEIILHAVFRSQDQMDATRGGLIGRDDVLKAAGAEEVKARLATLIDKTPRIFDAADLAEAFRVYLGGEGLAELRADLEKVGTEEGQLIADREAWYGKHDAGLKLGKKYLDLVANTGEKFAGFKVSLPGPKRRDTHSKINQLQRFNVNVGLVIYEGPRQFSVLYRLLIKDLVVKELSQLCRNAYEASGQVDEAGFTLSEAAFWVYSLMNLEEGKAKLQGGDAAGAFMAEESGQLPATVLDRSKNRTAFRLAVERIRESRQLGDKAKAQKDLEALKQKSEFQDMPEFKDVVPDLEKDLK